MHMVFFSAVDTPLFSETWSPRSSAGYAGTCIFLIILAIIFRILTAVKHRLEAKLLERALKRRYVVVAGKQREADRIRAASRDTDSERGAVSASLGGEKDEFAQSGVLRVNGVEEDVRMVQRTSHSPVQPWRLSVDLPRALMSTVVLGVGYLL